MNYILLSEKRTGSTFLQTALNSHPQIICYDELFIPNLRKVRHDDTEFFLDKITKYKYNKYYLKILVKDYLNKIFDKGENVGFNLIYSQIEYWYKRDIKLYDILKEFNCKTIHLKRNFFKTVMSMKTKGLHKKKIDNKEIEKVYLDPKELNKEIEIYIKRYKEWGKIFKHNLNIDFEDVIPENNITTGIKKYGMFNVVSKEKTYMSPKMNKKICDFFKVDNVPMYSNITKFIPDIWEYVKNSDEIKEYFKLQ